jgi:hypothetical protein
MLLPSGGPFQRTPHTGTYTNFERFLVKVPQTAVAVTIIATPAATASAQTL